MLTRLIETPRSTTWSPGTNKLTRRKRASRRDKSRFVSPNSVTNDSSVRILSLL